MKGVTREELTRLMHLATPGPVLYAPPEEQAILNDLVEQGRADRITVDNGSFEWGITPAGREALRLWPLVKAAMEGSR